MLQDLLEDCGGDALGRNWVLHDADLLDGSVVLALVVRDDHHNDARLQWDDLIESLDVGGRPVVSDGDNLRVPELHADARCSFVHTIDHLLNGSSIP